MDTTKKFDGYAGDYTVGRPNWKGIATTRHISMRLQRYLTGIPKTDWCPLQINRLRISEKQDNNGSGFLRIISIKK